MLQKKHTILFFHYLVLQLLLFRLFIAIELNFFPFPPCYNKSVGDFFSRKQVDLALVDASFVSHISFQFLYKPSKLSLMHFWSVVRALFYRHISVCNMYFYGPKYIFEYNKLLHLVLEWSVSCHKTNNTMLYLLFFFASFFSQKIPVFYVVLALHKWSVLLVRSDRAFYTVFR